VLKATPSSDTASSSGMHAAGASARGAAIERVSWCVLVAVVVAAVGAEPSCPPPTVGVDSPVGAPVNPAPVSSVSEAPFAVSSGARVKAPSPRSFQSEGTA